MPYEMTRIESKQWTSRDTATKIATRTAIISEAKRRAVASGVQCEVKRADGVVVDIVYPEAE